MKIIAGFLVTAAFLSAYGCNNKEIAPMRPAEKFIGSVLECVNYTDTHIGSMTRPAEEAAKRLVQGGRIFITDDESLFLSGDDKVRVSEAGVVYTIHDQSGGFVAEACHRAGGLGFLEPLSDEVNLTAADVVLIGTLDLHPEEQRAHITAIKQKGTLVIVFGSGKSSIAPMADFVIDNGLGAGLAPVFDIGSYKPTGPLAGIANIINMWTFTSELVSACTREGKMPTLWQSMFVPGAEARNERIGKSVFEADIHVDPVEPQVLGRQYVAAVRGFFEKIRTNELPDFQNAGKMCADTISHGNNVVTYLIGHFMTSQSRMPDFPDVFTVLDQTNIPEQIDEKLHQGDVLLHVGYSYYPEGILKKARERSAKTICIMTPGRRSAERARR